MKKKLLTSAAIASFLTAAGIVIPQTDIFAADTPNTPHPSTLPGAQPSTHPSEIEKKEKIVTTSNPLNLNKVYEGGWGHHNINKKKVDSFADYTLKDISLDNNKNLNIQTSSSDLSVNSVEYINEANGNKYELNVKKGTVKNSYLADTSKLIGGNYLLNNIHLSNSFENKELNTEIIYTDEENQRGWSGDAPEINLSRKDLYKYDNKTKIKNLSETKLPELGDKDYLVYSDKSQVGGNDVLKVTVKYKPGLERFADKMLLEYYSPNKPGSEAESIAGKAMLVYHHKALPGKITLSQIKDGEMIGESGSFDVDMTLDSEGNDVFYIKNFKNTDPGHYYLRQLHDLDLTKGDLSNFEFDLNPAGESIYRTDKAEQPKVEEPKANKPKVEEPKIVKPVEPTFPKVELPEKPKTKVISQSVGDREITVRFDSTKIPAIDFYAEEVKDKDARVVITLNNPSLLSNIALGEAIKSYVCETFAQLIPEALKYQSIDTKFDFVYNLQNPDVVKTISACILLSYINKIDTYTFEGNDKNWDSEEFLEESYDANVDGVDVMVEAMLSLEETTSKVIEKTIEDEFVKERINITTGNWTCASQTCKALNNTRVEGLELLILSLFNKMETNM